MTDLAEPQTIENGESAASPSRVWQDRGVRRAIEYLSERNQPIHYKKILNQLRGELQPTGEALSKTDSGTERWANRILWGTSDAVAAGWLTKRDGMWEVTAQGRAALAEYPSGPAFLNEAKKGSRARPKPARRAWLVHGSSVGGTSLVPTWLRESFVSVAASHLPRIQPDITTEQLEASVDASYGHLKNDELKSKRSEILSFVRTMKADDVVLTTLDSSVYVGDVTGEVVYSESEGGRASLQRAVVWKNPEQPIGYTDLPAPLPAHLTAAGEVVDLTGDLALIDSLSPIEPPPPPPPKLRLPDPALAHELLVGFDWLSEVVELLEERKQLIFYGPPGTGKTFLARAIARHVTGGPERVRLVQFHPSYTYEDFFEGYRPTQASGGVLSFELRAGPLRQIVNQAQEHRDQTFVLIVDEINRANLAKVFGELYFLLEYRDEAVDLLYSPDDHRFTLPPNLYLIGTMNTADRSIALVDAAMRRRFSFMPLDPSKEPTKSMLRRWITKEGIESQAALLLDELNSRIKDEDFRIGPSYFMKSNDHSGSKLERVWRTSIMPLLEEHYYDERTTLDSRYSYRAVLEKINRPTEPQ